LTPPKKEPTPVVEEAKPAGNEADDRPEPPKSTIKVSTKLIRPKPGESASNPKPAVRVGSQTQDRAESQARNQALARAQSGLRSAVETLSANLSSGTSIEPFGPGGGGEVYANWFQAVQSRYDAAWRDPADVTDELATVRVRVKVSRNGTVLVDDIVKPSGIRALDQSVQEALDRVRAEGLPELPKSATESERTFYINFNLKSKRQIG
jgi:TonB family protein